MNTKSEFTYQPRMELVLDGCEYRVDKDSIRASDQYGQSVILLPDGLYTYARYNQWAIRVGERVYALEMESVDLFGEHGSDWFGLKRFRDPLPAIIHIFGPAIYALDRQERRGHTHYGNPLGNTDEVAIDTE